MKKIIIIAMLLPIFCFSQNNKHNFFGIDLDLDWYTLTNSQAMSYSDGMDDSTQNLYVISRFDNSNNKIDQTFLNIGFSELLLCFPKQKNANLKTLSPDLLIARISYDNKIAYQERSSSDMVKILKILNNKFGSADLNMKKEQYSVYKWNGVYDETALTCREDELKITLIYNKQ